MVSIGEQLSALERIAFREQCPDGEAEQLRQIARDALGWNSEPGDTLKTNEEAVERVAVAVWELETERQGEPSAWLEGSAETRKHYRLVAHVAIVALLRHSTGGEA